MTVVAFWVVLATAGIALCFKKTHAALLVAVVAMFFVGVHLGAGSLGHMIDTFVTSIPKNVASG